MGRSVWGCGLGLCLWAVSAWGAEAPPDKCPPSDTKNSAAVSAAPTEHDTAEADLLKSRLKEAAGKLAKAQTFTLRYQFEPGEQVRWRVVQLVTVDTRIRGTEEVAKTRSVSTKTWTVSKVDEAGNVTFVHQIDDADMWQSVSGGAEVKYNSRTDPVAPREYEHVSRAVGTPLATITLSPAGQVVKRENMQPLFSPGLADLAIPLPEGPVRVDTKWNLPEEVKIRLEDGRVQRVLTRQVFQLQKVETGVATISVRTEVLTPVSDPKVQSQLVRRLLNGKVKFDVDAGRVISKQLDLDETVIGFSGAESVMQYLARTTEELLPAKGGEHPAKRSVTSTAR